MTLAEATHLVRLLAARRLAVGMVVDFDTEPASYKVMVRLGDGEQIDLAEFGTSLWLRGYRARYAGAGVLEFDASAKLLLPPDPAEPVDATAEPELDAYPPGWQPWQSGWGTR